MRCTICGFDNPEFNRVCALCSTPLPSPGSAESDKTRTLPTPFFQFSRGRMFAGRFEIIEELGQGGMGIIYRVFDQKTQEDIAVKILNPEITAQAGTIERFRNELKLARKISHKNVCRMYDLTEADGTYYLIMEYVPGESLKSVMRMTRQLSVGRSVDIAKQVCEGLAEAHRMGVIHRDLKPGNIMIDREGTARIMDFGIAHSLEKKGTTVGGVMIGTPEYMSPEQASGEEADERSDLYSLGIMLYEMVTGRRPFEGESALGIAMKHKSEKPRDPREFSAQVTPELSRLILRCLEKDKIKRPQSAEELLTELSSVEGSLPLSEKTPLKKRPTREKTVEMRRRTLISYLAGAVAVTIILILAGWHLISGRRGAVESIAVLPFENVNADADTEYLGDGITESIISKLTQLPGLKKVIARTSVFRYKGQKIDPQTAGRELGVDAVLASRMIRQQDDLSISVELIKVRDNSRLWGEQYRLRVSNVFAVEKMITSSITENMRLRLSGEQLNRLSKDYTKNSQAFVVYSKGSYFWNKRTEQDLKKAIEYFDEAIRLDPNYALPYTGLAYSYLLIPEYGGSSPIEAYPKAKAAALKALEIDPELSEAHVSLAQLKWRYDWDWPAAEKEYKLAIKLDPGNATAHHWYGFDLMCFGRHDEAISEIRRALELDPGSLVINRNLGQAFYRAGRYAEAREALHRTMEMSPEFSFIHFYLGSIALEESQYEEALKEFIKEKEAAKGWSSRVEGLIGVAYLKLGQRDRALEILDEMLKESEKKYIPATSVAFLCFSLGENDKGFEWLNKAFNQYDSFLRVLKVDHIYDNVRSDPRFQELMRRVGLH